MEACDYLPYIRACAAKARAPRAVAGLKRRLDAFVNADVGNQKVAGDSRVKRVMETLDMFEGYIRSPSQREFHTNFLHACLPHIYGTVDFENNRERILREHSLEDMDYEILVCTPRRWGKTVSVSMWCAALLYHVPDMWISVFSTGQRASTSLLDLTSKLFLQLPNAKDRILKKNQEQFFIKGDSPSDMRRLFSFPSSVAGLKGQGELLSLGSFSPY